MRITKEFLGICANHCRGLIAKASDKTEKAFFKKLSEDTFIDPLIKPFGSDEFQLFIEQIRQTTQVTPNDATYMKEIKERAHNAVLSKMSLDDLDTTRSISANLKLMPVVGSALEQKLPKGLSINLAQLLDFRTDWKDILVRHNFVMLKDLINDARYWNHDVKNFTYNMGDIYTEAEQEELYNTFILREEFSDALSKIQNLCRQNYRGSEEPYYQYKTLEQFQTDTFVWPIVKDTAIVSNFIAEQKRKAEEAKEKREEALRIKREREAEERKAKLAAIERGENPETVTIKPKSEINVTLLKGINKMVD